MTHGKRRSTRSLRSVRSLGAAMAVACLVVPPAVAGAATTVVPWRIGTYTVYAPAITPGSFGTLVLDPGGTGGPGSVTWSGEHTLTVVTDGSTQVGEIHAVFVAPRSPTGLGSAAQPGSITVTLNGGVLWQNAPCWAVRTGGIHR